MTLALGLSLIGVHPGHFVIVGSGIKSIDGFTLEAISEIEHVDWLRRHSFLRLCKSFPPYNRPDCLFAEVGVDPSCSG